MNIQILSNDKSNTISFDSPALLSDLISLANNEHDMPCGGKGICGKCKVVARGNLSPISDTERKLLTDGEIALGMRLSCLTRAEGDCFVTVNPRLEFTNIVTHGKMPQFTMAPISHGYGLAVDIGTTTIAAYLYNLSDCSQVKNICKKNPQTIFGADVISRIQKSLDGDGEALANSIVSCLDEIITEFIDSGATNNSKISAAVITGNTAMLYLLLNLNVRPLAAIPFIPDRYFGEFLTSQDLGFKNNIEKIYLPRAIAAYVGSDITTALISSGLTSEIKPSLLLDIGTNGEMALQSSGRLVCCSTAAGPAFEGAGIHMGMNALPGAISSVFMKNDKIQYSTIGNLPAIGICGSGIADAAAVLLSNGIIDETGCICEENHNFLENITEYDDKPAFKFDNCDVIITSQDIRAIQLAKSAICAGIFTLLHECDMSPDQVENVYIAGGFGSFINCENAEIIGLIPKGFADKSQSIGNAAGMGASAILLSSEALIKSRDTALSAETIELSSSPYFMDKYVECMMF